MTKKFDGIYAFLWAVFISHNMLSWFKSTILSEIELEVVGAKILVKKLGSTVAEVRITADSIEIVLPHISALARRFAECLQPTYVQLSLFRT